MQQEEAIWLKLLLLLLQMLNIRQTCQTGLRMNHENLIILSISKGIFICKMKLTKVTNAEEFLICIVVIDYFLSIKDKKF